MERAYAGVPAAERVAERRRRLLEAGFDLIAEGGSANLTVSGVCKRAKLTSRYYYEHFSDREELLNEIFARQSDEVTQAILAATIAAPDDPQQRGEAGVLALVEALEQDPRRVRLSLAEGDDSLLRQRHAVTRRLSAAMAENAQLVWPQAVRHPELVPVVSALAVGGVLDLVIRWFGGELDMDRSELARTCARFTVATGDALLGER